MSEQSNILDIVKTKLIQAATATTTSDGREAIQKDIKSLLGQFDNIASQTNYNGITLLQKDDGSAQDPLSFQIGEDKDYEITLTQSRASNTSKLGGGADTIANGDTIAASEGQNISSTAAVSLTSDSGVLDVTVSGQLGVIQSDSATLTIDVSAENEDLKDAMAAIAAASTTAVITDNGDDTYSLVAGQDLDLKDLNFTSTVLTQDAATEAITLNKGAGALALDTTVTVSNNKSDRTISMSGASTMTGGNLLEDLKNLAETGLTQQKAEDFMSTIDEALTQLNANRATFGSTQNQLESSIRNLETTFTNLKAAESVIRDVDYAQESASFNKQNIIAQAGTYAMSQANAMQQNVSRLLQ
jgi:flagellin